MCGIVGIFRTQSAVEESEISRMAEQIRHRGPDGQGIKLFPQGAIGHRRLSIIDISTGAQPMCNETGSVWITFNGEIYNYLELRDRLKALGHVFATNSDTEVIVHGYEEWGAGLLQQLRGMFAFAITDLEKQQVLVARDHFGIKPVYYYSDGKTFAFASELQAFNAVQNIRRTVDLTAIDEYLWFQYIPAPKTIWKEIRKLEPAHYFVYHFDGRVEEPKCFWSIDFSKKRNRTAAQWMEEAEQVIKDSVQAHLVSDVPFGAFLSGGIDSTLVVSYMSQLLNKPVKTFSIGFEESEFNELEYSELAAKKFGTQHYTELVRPDALGMLSLLTKHYGEPYGDSSAIPTYYVCKLAREHVTMSLSGDGGDEAFAGYGSYIMWMKYQAISYRSGWKKKLFPLAQSLWPSRYPATDTLARWMERIQYFSTAQRKTLWRPDVENGFQDSNEAFERLFRQTSALSLANKAQFMDMKTYMPYDILTKVDVASMINSLEVRTPLIDKNVWEFAATIPESFNISSNNGEWNGKQILKNILRKQFPQNFIDRPKKGFAVPLSKWFAKGGSLHDMINDRLLSQQSHVLHYFDREKVAGLVSANQSGHLWLLLFLEEWLSQQQTNV